MMRYIGVGLGGVGLLLLAACGGTVDLQEGQGGGAGTAPTAGTGVGGVAGSGGGGVAGTSPRGGAAGAASPGGSGGESGFPLPEAGALAYDGDSDGSGRAIYLHWFEEGCRQRLTDPELAAKQA